MDPQTKKQDDKDEKTTQKDENPTINNDGHNRHQDNELKNLQQQTTKLREEVHEVKDETEKMTDVPKPSRLVKVDDDQKDDFNEKSKDDKINMKTERVDLLHVIANQTIATLNGHATLSGLKSAPLSAYEFGKISRDVAGNFGLSPFRISLEMPQLFKFVPMYNEAQQTNIPDMIIAKFSADDVLDVVSKSIQLFNISTMTVRVELNDKILNVSVLDPNSLEEGAIKLQTLIPSARLNPQADVSFIENRIFSVLTAFKALNDILIAMPKKIVCLDTVRGGPTAIALSEMPFYKDLHPHPYYSVFSNLPDWARMYFDQAYQRCPLEIGDMAVDSYAGKKLSQINKTVIDQYTASVLRANFNKMRNHTLTTDQLHDMIMASMFEKDKLEIHSLIDVEDLTLLYNYTSAEYNLALFNIVTSRNMKVMITDFLHEELSKTNRFAVADIQDIWKGLQLGDVYSQKFNSDWIQSIYIGNNTTPYQMLIYETFSDFFVFNPKFSSLPDSLNAVTEIISIYTFMLLYPRITQRIIHRIGYRLTQLYNTMFPQVFNLFKMTYGDVRTRFGRDKFGTYGHQISSQESQMGYVYSIFTALPLTNQKTKQSGLLYDFVSLISNMRALVLPTTQTISLERKSKAGYPYLFDSYTAYASWEPINYMDYNVNQETSLGMKLRALIGESNRFKELFLRQNPASSQIPRAFEAYYTAWTTQLSRLIATAGLPYQLTSAMMQETLFNSPFFVGSMYNPTPERFWYVQKDVGIGPLAGTALSSIIIPSKIQVDSLKLNVGMSLAMSLEGEYVRNTIVPEEVSSTYEQNKNRIRSDITCMDALACFKMMNKILAHGRDFGYAMQVAQWMVTPGADDNPFKDVAGEISKYMKVAVWAPLIRKIFDFFEVSFDDYFIKNISNNSMLADGRYLDRTLIVVNPLTAMPEKDQPQNSKFNVKFEYMVPADIEKVSILTKPLLTLNSKVIYVQKDWYFGRLTVNELGPTQRALKEANWTDEASFDLTTRFFRSTAKNGQIAQLEYISEITGQHVTMTLPYTATNTPILLLKIDELEQIPLQYLRVLAKAISLGKIILKIKNFKIRVVIEDRPSKTIDYSTDYMSEQDVFDIISLPSGTIKEWRFQSTNYATNFVANALVIPGYIQWFATEYEADRNLFASAITNAVVRPSQTKLPLPEEMGYGPDELGMKFPDQSLKTESNLINWNNSVPTVSTKLLNNVDVQIIPWYPQYLGTS